MNLAQKRSEARALRQSEQFGEAAIMLRDLWEQEGNCYDGAGLLHCFRKLRKLDEVWRIADALYEKCRSLEWARLETMWGYDSLLAGLADEMALETVIEYAERVLSLDPNPLALRRAVFAVLARAKAWKRWDIVTAWLDRVSPSQLDNSAMVFDGSTGWSYRAVWYNYKANALIEVGDYAAAAGLASTAKTFFPQQDRFFQRLVAKGLCLLGELNEGLRVYRELVEPGGGEWWIRHEYAQFLAQTGQRTEAIKQMRQAALMVEDTKMAVSLLMDLGQLYAFEGATEIATIHFHLVKETRESMNWPMPTELRRAIGDTQRPTGDLVSKCRHYWRSEIAENAHKVDMVNESVERYGQHTTALAESVSAGKEIAIALISCTSAKLGYSCPAYQLYSASPGFRAAWKYAQLVAERVFILSAKHGLLDPETVVDPYNETLNEKSGEQRRTWAEGVLTSLSSVSDFERDRFILLAGQRYVEHLLPHLKNKELPLRGKVFGERIPTLERLTAETSKRVSADEIHALFNSLPRYSADSIAGPPFRDGVYVFFEAREKLGHFDRIVRVGTHRSDGRLLGRLHDHYMTQNMEGSIFRKNIGRAMTGDVHVQSSRELENRISSHLKSNFTFTCVPVQTEEERLRLEEGLIAALNEDPNFGPGKEWFGLRSPVASIRRSGLWNVKGLEAMPLTQQELSQLKALAKVNNHSVDGKTQLEEFRLFSIPPAYGRVNQDGASMTTAQIRAHIRGLLATARQEGQTSIVLVSGSIHKSLNLRNKMPSVCNAMYQVMGPSDEILHTTPSGKSSTIKIKYDTTMN